MGKYIKQFSTQADYTAAQATLDLPNVSLITENMTVEFKPYVPAPSPTIEMVDLGLPSGLKWAAMNVGANSVTDAGLYFQYGDTQGYTADQVGDGEGQKYFDWEDYKYAELDTSGSNGSGSGSGSGGSGIIMTKYNETDGKRVLEPEDDAAYQATNGALRMPTMEEFEELLNTTYVTNARVTDYNGSGVNGILFTSRSNGNTLFFPASGYCYAGSLDNRGSGGCVWSTTVDPSAINYGRYLYFDSSHINVGTYFYERCYGQSVRGVSL